MFSMLLRRPLLLLLAFLGIALVGGVYVRAREQAAMAAMYPLATPEAQKAMQEQFLNAASPDAGANAGLQQAVAASAITSPVDAANASAAFPSAESYPSASIVAANAPTSDGPQTIGIPSEALDVTYSSQRNSMWCWAASIQMVLQYHGIRTVQQEIVARTFGPDARGALPNRAGDLASITANLNNFNVDRAGTTYQVESTFGEGAPPVELLLDELDRREPLIIGYRSGPNMGHAVVITGARYNRTPQGLVVQTIIVRDPWPSDENRANAGRVEYDAREFAPKIQGYWKVRVRR